MHSFINNSSRVLAFFLVIYLFTTSLKVKANEFLLEWNTQASLPYPISGHSSIANRNSIFVFGGSAQTGYSHNEILKTDITEDNEMKNWEIYSSMLDELIYLESININEKVYLLGGYWDNINGKYGSSDKVYYSSLSTLKSSGLLSSSYLPKLLSLGRSAVIGNWLYYAGGWTDYEANANDQVYKAEILSDGSLSNWTLAGTIPEKLFKFGLVGHENKLIFIGGMNNFGETLSRVRAANIDLNTGNITSWSLLNPLPKPSNCHSTVANSKGVFVLGGWGDGNNLDTVLFSSFDSDGLVNDWTTSEFRIPQKICGGSANIINDHIYIIGGYAVDPLFSGYSDKVWGTKIASPFFDPPVEPTTTPTIEPTIYPTPTVIPTPTKVPLVLIPGLGASFHESLLHLGDVAKNEDWRLAPYVKNYDNFIDKKIHEGYEMNKNFYIYNYDWRKPVMDNALELRYYLQDKQVNKVDIVGHSMGGLIGSSFAINNKNLTNSVITYGSPFKGSAKAYKAFEGVDFSDLPIYEKISISLFVKSNAGKFDSDVEVIQKNVPSLQNLLPTYNFLKLKNGNVLPLSKMVWKNNYWPNIENNITNILSILKNMFGSYTDTEDWYTVQNRNIVDQILGKWKDGKPIETHYSSGDGTVKEESANLQLNNSFRIPYVLHGDLLSVNENYPQYKDSIIMTIASPATFEVLTVDNNTLTPVDNFLIIENPLEGVYKVSIKPIDSGGRYSFYFGKFFGGNYYWEEVNGNIVSGVTDYYFNFKRNDKYLGSDPKTSAINKISSLQDYTNNSVLNNGEKEVFGKFLDQLLNNVTNFENLKEQQKIDLIRSIIQKCNQLDNAWNNQSQDYAKHTIYQLRLILRDVISLI